MRIVLADEISPDSCRLWDLQTNEKLDKDRFSAAILRAGWSKPIAKSPSASASCRKSVQGRKTRGLYWSNNILVNN